MSLYSTFARPSCLNDVGTFYDRGYTALDGAKEYISRLAGV